LLGVLALVLCACGGGDGAPTSGRREIGETLPARIRTAGVLTVGSDIEYAPHEFYVGTSTEPQGFDVDLANAMARKLDLTARFVNFTDLDGLLPAVVAGRFDVVMSAMVDTPERRRMGVTFVDYLVAGTSMLVGEGNPHRVLSMDDLCGRPVAVQRDTEQDLRTVPDQSARCRVLGRSEIAVVALGSEDAALERLRAGRVIGVLADSSVAGYIAETAGAGAEFDAIGPQPGGDAYGIAVATSDADLRDAIVDALAAVMDDGTYRTLLDKWGLGAAGVSAPAVNGRPVAPSGARAPVRPRCCA
jgi:polar amino acid transport system substrate-binding protein